MAKIDTRSLGNFAGTLIYVRGKVGYSHIASQVDGEALTRQNMIRQTKGQSLYNRPYSTMTVNDAVVRVADKQNPTIPEQWAMSRLYRAANANSNGFSFTGDNKGNSLPNLYHLGKNNNDETIMIGENPDGKELAIGSDVTMVLRIFNTKRGPGVTLDSVIVNAETIEWYNGTTANQIAKELQFAGAIAAEPAPVMAAPEASNPVAPTSQQVDYPYDDDGAPFSANAPAPAQTQPLENAGFEPYGPGLMNNRAY